MTHRSPAVWITGVRSGVGEALAEAFLGGGWRVYGSSRTHPPRNAAWLRHTNGSFIPMDVRSHASVQKAWTRIRKQAGGLDMLVNNAGITSFREIRSTPSREFRDIIDTNLTGLYETTHAVLPHLRKRRGGMIVNILSYAAKTVYTRSGAYAASKAGADMLMRVIREENREAGIRVVNVFPGATETPMWSAQMRRAHGRRMMQAQDVAEAVFALTGRPVSAVPEEIVLRPEIGDLTV